MARLTIKNFRAIEHLEIDLAEPLTVLAGPNASGKTTVLDAMAFVLAPLAGWDALRDELGHRDDVRVLQVPTKGAPSRERCYPMSVSLNDEPGSGVLLRKVSSEIGSPEDISAPIRGNSAHEGDSLSLFLSYGTARAVAPTLRIDDQLADPTFRTSAYHRALRASVNDPATAAWVKWRAEDLVQRTGAAMQSGGDVASVRALDLDSLNEATATVLDDARRAYHNFNERTFFVEMTSGEHLPFASLSDGQRNLAGLAADIARRALQLNPHLGKDAPRETSGWVLIDEVDLHLHPKWQRSVLANLTRAFPKLRFVVTTHSPQVLSSVKRECIRLIERTETGHHVVVPNHETNGRDSNALLEDVFGVPHRPEGHLQRLRTAAELVERERLVDARAMVDAFEREGLGDDPDVMTLRWELERAEDHAAHPQGG